MLLPWSNHGIRMPSLSLLAEDAICALHNGINCGIANNGVCDGGEVVTVSRICRPAATGRAPRVARKFTQW